MEDVKDESLSFGSSCVDFVNAILDKGETALYLLH
jgi:hypothetical protein